jgi:hypothetical protein
MKGYESPFYPSSSPSPSSFFQIIPIVVAVKMYEAFDKEHPENVQRIHRSVRLFYGTVLKQLQAEVSDSTRKEGNETGRSDDRARSHFLVLLQRLGATRIP